MNRITGNRLLGRVLLTACVLALVIAPIAEAKPRKAPAKTQRTVSVDYSAPSGAYVAVLNIGWCVQGQGCFSTGVAPGEKYVDVEVTDQSGQPVPFEVGFKGSSQIFCGSADDIYLNGAKQIDFGPMVGDVPNCPGPGTTGTMNLTLSNLP